MKSISILSVAVALAISGSLSSAAIPTRPEKERAAIAERHSAQQVYVAPGKLDEYYAILSGGQSGSVFVYGIPSCRFIKEIPIFEPRAGLGYANNPGSEATNGWPRPARCGATRIIRC